MQGKFIELCNLDVLQKMRFEKKYYDQYKKKFKLIIKKLILLKNFLNIFVK